MRGRLARAWLGGLVTVGAAALVTGLGATTGSDARATTPGVSLALRYAVSTKQGESDPRYHFERGREGRLALTISDVRHRIARDGWTTVHAGDATWGLRLAHLARGSTLVTVPRGEPRLIAPNVLEARRGAVLETWSSGPLGLQQAWVIDRRPAGGAALELVFAERAAGARVVDEGAALAVGELRFGGLVAFDATGREFSSRFVRTLSGPAIVVDDRGARYPLTVDPSYSQQTVLSRPVAGSGYFGMSVGLSADGTVAVAGSRDDTTEGRAYVFTRSSATWSYAATLDPSATQLGSDTTTDDDFGTSLAISGDGSTIVVGATSDKGASNASYRGSVFVFTRPGGSWSGAGTRNEAGLLEPSSGGAHFDFGRSVALSYDGSVVVVGASGYGSTSLAGKAHIFLKPGGGWGNATENATLSGSDSDVYDEFGYAVAIDGPGDTVAVGAYADDTSPSYDQGSVYVFAKSGGTWTTTAQQDAKLTASDAAYQDWLGRSIAMSPSGSTVLAGAMFWEGSSTPTNVGAGYLWARPGASWSSATQTETALLTVDTSYDTAEDSAGRAVALSQDSSSADSSVAVLLLERGDNVAKGLPKFISFEKPGGGWASASAVPKSITVTSGLSSLYTSSPSSYYDGGDSIATAANGSYVLLGSASGDAANMGINEGWAVMWNSSISSDATLSSLSLSSGSLSPSFASGTTSYTASVSNGTSSITVTPTRNESGATIQARVNGGSYSSVTSGSASGSLAVDVGSNTVDVLVTAGDGATTATYTVTVTRQSTDATLSALALSSGSLSPSFASGTTSYTASVSNASSSITVTPTRSNSQASVQARVNGGSYASVTSGSASGSLSLSVGSNTVDVKVTAGDGSTTSTTTVTVTRAASTDATLSALALSSGSLSGAFASGTTSYTATVSNATSSITVTPTRAESTATIQARVGGGSYASVTSGSASGSLALSVGSNTVNVLVTAGDGSSTATYTVTVTRSAADATLSALSLSSGSLAPSFGSGTTSYTASVSNATSSITVTPTRNEGTATLQARVNGGSYASVTSGSASAGLSLVVGANTVDVLVTAGDGSTTATYTVTVTRLSSDATLSALSLSSGSLSGAFASGTASYTASAEVASIAVTATRSNDQATIEARVNGGAYVSVTSGAASAGLSLNEGSNTVDVRVTAGDGSTSTYTVTVTRVVVATVAAAPVAVPRAAYCLNGKFLNLERGQPDRDPKYKGATPAIIVAGKGKTCASGGPPAPDPVPVTAAASSAGTAPVPAPEPSSATPSVVVAAVTQSVQSGASSERVAITRHTVSLKQDPVALRLSFDGGATSKGWVDTGASFSVATPKSVVWVQTRDTASASSAWTPVRLAPPRVLDVESKPATSGERTEHRLTLSEDPASVRVSFDAGRTSTAVSASSNSVALVTQRSVVWVQVRTKDGLAPTWEQVRLAPPATDVVTVEAGAVAKASLGSRHTVTLAEDLGDVRLSFDGGKTARAWVDVGKVFTVYTTLPAVWVQVRDIRDGAVSSWKRVELRTPELRA